MPKQIDLTGNRYGKWTVIKRVGKLKCLCKCDCGTEKEVLISNLRGGRSLSCGCDSRNNLIGKKIGKLTVLRKLPQTKSYVQYECQCECGNVIIRPYCTLTKSKEKCCPDCRESKIEDISGQKFGRLTAIKFAGINKAKQTLWECRCDCGNTIIAHKQNLKNGHTKSCGCYNIDVASERTKTHGETKLRIYTIWHDMLLRCYSKKHLSYDLYGGRGITVCKEWKDSYEAFRDWAYNNGYAENLSIDRKDVNGNYCPENCRWANNITQANNTRRNRMITINGETDTLANWCRKYNAPYGRVSSRLRLKWDILEALTTPRLPSKSYRNKGRE